MAKNLVEILRRKIRAEPEMEAAMATIVGPAPLESSDYILNRFISTRYTVLINCGIVFLKNFGTRI